jgi:hypothetical protein
VFSSGVFQGDLFSSERDEMFSMFSCRSLEFFELHGTGQGAVFTPWVH